MSFLKYPKEENNSQTPSSTETASFHTASANNSQSSSASSPAVASVASSESAAVLTSPAVASLTTITKKLSKTQKKNLKTREKLKKKSIELKENGQPPLPKRFEVVKSQNYQLLKLVIRVEFTLTYAMTCLLPFNLIQSLCTG